MRAGVIGPAGIGRVHIEALRRIGVDVVAVAASSPERSERFAAELGVENACADARSLAQHPDVDVVHVCTPNSLHAEQASIAIEAGRHVVCEKPLATSAADAARLLEQAREAGVVHAVAYVYRFDPKVAGLRRRIAEGGLGRVHLIHGAYLLDEVLADLTGPGSWMLDPARMGPSLSLADVGVHWWDQVEYLTGRHVVEAFCTRQSARDPAAPGEDSAALILRLEGGAVAVAAISGAAPGHENTLEIEVLGTEASARWEDDSADRLDTFCDLLASVYAGIEGREGPPYPTFEDGLRGMRVLEALLESADSGSWARVAG